MDVSAGAHVHGPIPAAAGIGLRFPHHELIVRERPAVAWFEVHAENYFGGGTVRQILRQVRRDYPLSLHGVGLSLGSVDELALSHLQQLRRLIADVQPAFVSEHLSWSTLHGHYLADLLPLPLTEEALDLLTRRVDQTQEYLGRRILIENPSSYLQWRHSTIPEWEFLSALAARTGCGLLCDVNNIYVSASNHGWDATHYIRALPAAAVEEIHLAGHARTVLEDGREVLIDTHGTRVAAGVWALYELALRHFGPRPTLIEWDTDIPPFTVLLDEAAGAALRLRACAEVHADAA